MDTKLPLPNLIEPLLLPNDPTEEIRLYKELQQNFVDRYEQIFMDDLAHKTVLIIPSFTLDEEILARVDGVQYYEERLLCLLMLLRMPYTRVIYVTSMPIDQAIIDYYIHLLPGITAYHAMQRLTLLSCFDASKRSLTQKILERPRLLQRIKDNIPSTQLSHIACFNVTELERTLAVKLHLPIFGCDPDLLYLGSKSMGRKLFRAANIAIPDGFEDLNTKADIVDALTRLKTAKPALRKAIVKVNEGFSGDGNAVFSYHGIPETGELAGWINDVLPNQLKMVGNDMDYGTFLKKFDEMGGIAEIFIEGDEKTSPSVQCRINPTGNVEVLSTHDQLLGGESNQVFLGATFPANNAYASEIGILSEKISFELQKYGVMGRYAIDFISVKNGNAWTHYAIEINLRKGGTTHPYLMLQFLTRGNYNAADGEYYTANNQHRYYVCSDNLQQPHYRGLTPHDMIDIAMVNGLLYDSSTQEGVIFHLISTLSQFGKLGVLCIGTSHDRANRFYNKTIEVLDREGKKNMAGLVG